MRCRPIAICALLFSISSLSQAGLAQTRQDALQVLQTLQSRCENGVNYDGFAAALGETQSQLGQFFDSNEPGKNPGFSDNVERALIAYQSVFVLWQSKVEYKQDFVRSDHPTIQIMLNTYPDAAALFRKSGEANVRDLISFFWDKADCRIADAKRSLGKGKR